VSFVRDVLAVVSKAGCDTGGCHGSASGKGGFKLSLWGEDPARDHAALTGKGRVDKRDPARSEILRKATGEDKHEGGVRFTADSESYRLLLQWLQEGAHHDLAQAPRLVGLRVEPARAVVRQPERSVQLRVTATFSDGAERDVTAWAVLEPTTTGVTLGPSGQVSAEAPHETVLQIRYLSGRTAARLAFVPALAAAPAVQEPEPDTLIDRLLADKQRALGLTPSPVADDATFLRRVTLDLTGVIPSADRTRAFLADPSPGKRAQVVDELLASSGFADYWSLLWADLLRVEEVVLDSRGVQAFHGWIRQAVAENRPLDRFAAELLAARGSTYENPPANFWRALRTPPARAEAVAQVFLGVRLQCAQCHNHPSDRWTQDDYHRFAGLLAAVDYEIKENKREDENDKNRFNGEQIVTLREKPEWKDPRTGKPAARGLLDPDQPALAEGADPLQATADWITRDPRFARAQANRTWFRLFGRGLVDPVDDVRDSNPAAHPELLEALATELAGSGFDARRLIRQIVLSRAYQRAAAPHPDSAWDEANHTHARVRRLTAEQLLDSLHAFLGLKPDFEAHGSLTRAAQLPGIRPVYKKAKPTACDQFLVRFGKPPRLSHSDLERANDTALAQVFTLVSGPDLHRWLRDPKNHFQAWIEANPAPAALLDQLYLASLGRPPAPPEREALEPLLADAAQRRRQVEDISWALINAKEFLLQH
jgi:hypothetical protein